MTGLTKYGILQLGSRQYCSMLFLWFLLLGCSNAQQGQAETNNQAYDRSQLGLNLAFDKQCTPYHCQSYQLRVTGNRLVKIASLNDKHSPLSKQLSDKEAKNIGQLIHQLKLLSTQTSIVPGQPQCANFSSDGDSYRLAIKKAKFSQILHIYAGCHNLASPYVRVIDWFQKQSSSLDRPES